jgi:flagellar basal-body rod protein FlgF/flagellar basal-body rod protein FlgG
MDSGLYAACTALMARSQALDLVSNNLANSSSPGYRGQHNTFSSMLANSGRGYLSPLNVAVNNFGILGGSQIDSSQGNLERTGNDLDLAIEGPGYFVVQTAAGRMINRNGNFHLSAQGQLITSEGDPVLGESGPIKIVGGPVTVSPDGTLSINGAVAGKLKIVEFPPGTEIKSIGKTYYSADSSKEKPATASKVQQGMLEGSNVNPVASAVELVAVQRYAELMQRALSMFHSEMNQIAAQDLPRVPNS